MGKDVDVSIPQPFVVDFGVDATTNSNIALTGNSELPISIGPVTINPLSIDIGLDNVKMDANLGLKGEIDMGLDDVNIDMGLDDINMCLSFAIKELPSMRMHFPVDIDFGVKLLGIPIFNFGICGKAMVVTEENPKKIFYSPKQPGTRSPRQGGLLADSIKVTIDDQ